MAAGAYKGLTISIGADTTKLSTALRGANSAIFKTQSELNKLNKALKLDPGNQNISQMQFGALSNQAMNLARQINVLKQGMQEMGNVASKANKDATIGDLASETANSTLALEDAKRVYNDINAELEKLYTSASNLSEAYGDGIKFGNADDEVNSLKIISDELQAVQGAAGLTDEEIDEMVSRIGELQEAWGPARDALDDYTNVAKLDEMNVSSPRPRRR